MPFVFEDEQPALTKQPQQPKANPSKSRFVFEDEDGLTPQVDVKLNYDVSDEDLDYANMSLEQRHARNMAESNPSIPKELWESAKGMGDAAVELVNPLNYLRAIARPDKALDAEAEKLQDATARAGETGSLWDYAEAGGRAITSSIPYLGPAIGSLGESLGRGIGGTSREAGQTFGNALAMTAAPAVLGKVNALAKARYPNLVAAAEKQYSQALGATKERFKQLSDKVTPELLKREVSGSRQSILKRATEESDLAGEALEAGYASLPKKSKAKFTPVLQELEVLKRETVVDGVVVDSAKHAAIDSVQQTLRKIAKAPEGSNLAKPISLESAVEARRALEGIVVRNKKNFSPSNTDSVAVDAAKAGSNAIRRELAKEYPSIARLNHEYSFWKNVESILEETQFRTKPQATPLGQTIMQGVGMGVGAAKGGLLSAFQKAYLFKQIKRVTESPRWRTVSAVKKQQLADYIIGGKLDNAVNLIKEMRAPQMLIGGATQAAIGGPSSSPSTEYIYEDSMHSVPGE